MLKFLIDTNVLIPVEPTAGEHAELLTAEAARFIGLCAVGRFPVFVHPRSIEEIAGDKNRERAALRLALARKYQLLPEPPEPQLRLTQVLGSPAVGTHDWYDQRILAAVAGNAVSFLVTEDTRLRRKARRLGVGDRVVGVLDATAIVEGFLDRAPPVPPAVRATKVHSIDVGDPILQSFREEYPRFDEWFAKCQSEHRPAWVIEGDQGDLAGFAIAKDEPAGPVANIRGTVLKICSFKVSEDFKGRRYGELLLKAIFEYAHSRSLEFAYVTVFPKYADLIVLFQHFGFVRINRRTALGEAILVKRFRPPAGEPHGLSPLAFHVRYGPRAVPDMVPWFLVPIQPRFARALFPETDTGLFAGQTAFGNALRKAYLCQSPITTITPGSVLVFYRSHEVRGVVAVGVVERVARSRSADQIGQLVARRTVYSAGEISAMCSREALVILFRQVLAARMLGGIEDLITAGVCRRAPQSIMRISPQGVAWLRETLRL